MAFQPDFNEWRHLVGSTTEDDTDRLEHLEIRLLEHRPTSIAQAAQILAVVIAEPDPRGDGRDALALRRVRDFLARSAKLEEEDDSSSAIAAA